MANLTVTAADVTSNNTTQSYRSYQAEEAITAGQAVRLNPTTGKLVLSQADTETNADFLGIALSSCGVDEYLVVAEAGSYISGATMVAGQYYVLSNTAGGLCPFTDLTTGQYATYAIFATSTTEATIRKIKTGASVA